MFHRNAALSPNRRIATEIRSQYYSYAFSTQGPDYTPERSALYGRDEAISWHSCSKMGVSCLQHVSNSPPSTHSDRHRYENKSHNRNILTVKAAILFNFPASSRTFYHKILHVRKKDNRQIRASSVSFK